MTSQAEISNREIRRFWVAKELFRLFASVDLVETVRDVLVADEMDHGQSYTSHIIRQASRIGADSFAATFRWRGGSNFVFMGISCLHVKSRTRSCYSPYVNLD